MTPEQELALAVEIMRLGQRVDELEHKLEAYRAHVTKKKLVYRKPVSREVAEEWLMSVKPLRRANGSDQ